MNLLIEKVRANQVARSEILAKKPSRICRNRPETSEILLKKPQIYSISRCGVRGPNPPSGSLVGVKKGARERPRSRGR